VSATEGENLPGVEWTFGDPSAATAPGSTGAGGATPTPEKCIGYGCSPEQDAETNEGEGEANDGKCGSDRPHPRTGGSWVPRRWLFAAHTASHAADSFPMRANSAGTKGRGSSMIRVVVVDDHPLIRETLTALLAATDDIAVVGQCADGSEVAAAIAETRPDVLVLDLRMPKVDGLTAARALRATDPEVRVIFFTGGLSHASAREAQTIGAAGYLLKDSDPAKLPAHIRSVAAGGTAWDSRAVAHLHDPRRSVGPRVLSPPHHVEACPPRLRQLPLRPQPGSPPASPAPSLPTPPGPL
jgi:DNA-binding NarL/FixJ family response regulator